MKMIPPHCKKDTERHKVKNKLILKLIPKNNKANIFVLFFSQTFIYEYIDICADIFLPKWDKTVWCCFITYVFHFGRMKDNILCSLIFCVVISNVKLASFPKTVSGWADGVQHVNMQC